MLLDRQLRKLGLSGDSPPDAEQWRGVLEHVRRTYTQADQDRYTLERSLMVVSGEMQQLHEELRRSEANFRVLVERSPDAIFVLSEDVVRYANPTMARLLGYDGPESLVGQRPLELFVHPEDRERVRELRRLVLGGGAPDDLRVRWIRRDGSTLVVEGVSTSIVFDDRPAIVTIVRDFTERLQAERDREAAASSLRASEERYRTLFDESPLAITLFDPTSLRILAVNGAAIGLYGYAREEFLALTLATLKEDGHSELLEKMASLRQATPIEEKRQVWRGTKKHRKKDGTLFDIAITSMPVVVDGRLAVLTAGIDVTETHRLEEQLRQAQKMEAIGRLAGGVAHDFNNLMSVVLSYAHLLGESEELGEESKADVAEIRLAGERATKLTRQLLAFSRKQVLAPEVVEINRVVGGMERMLRALVGDNVELDQSLQAQGKLHADPSQLEQILMNLVVNARDAMQDRGKVGIETRDIIVRDGAEIGVPEAAPGAYVALSVTDTGIGMDPATCARIFEPFFTTKEAGKGTGLGLSTVFGIVKQSGGHITVESAPARGATFRVLLPRFDQTSRPRSSFVPANAPLGGTEVVLLVEDDEQVRRSVRAILARNGYRVLEAQNAGEAFLIFEQEGSAIDLVVTDVMMPRMSGPDLVKRLLQVKPDLRVLYISGRAEDAVTRACVTGPAVGFLAKPITPNALARKLREMLDGGAATAVVRG